MSTSKVLQAINRSALRAVILISALSSQTPLWSQVCAPWSESTLNGFSLHRVIWDGTRYLAVGRNAGSSVILSNTDGTTWFNRLNGPGSELWDVSYSGTLYVAVGNGEITTSPNGSTWATTLASSNLQIRAVTSSNGINVAVGQDVSAGVAARSFVIGNGAPTIWNMQRTTAMHDVTGRDGLFVAVGNAGAISTSTNGQDWVSRISGTTQILRAIGHNEDQFVAVGENGTVLTSPDGTSWTVRASGITAALQDVVWNGTYFLAIGGGMAIASVDGIAWAAMAAPAVNGLATDGNTTFVGVATSGLTAVTTCTLQEFTPVSVVPWVVDNQAFTSKVAIFNNGATAANVRLRAVNREGVVEEMTRVIEGNGVLASEAADLFPGLTGYSLFIAADSASLYASFLTFNIEEISGGRSPSQTTGAFIDKLTARVVFGYVPGSESAAVVLVAAEETEAETPVTLTLFGAGGGSLLTKQVVLSGNRPLAALVRDLFNEIAIPDDASVEAVATNGARIAGTTFVFNQLSQPSMAAAFPSGKASLSFLGKSGYGHQNDIAIAGNYAYVAAANSGLLVLDISDTSAITPVANLYTGGNARKLFLRNNLVYLVDEIGLSIIDISDPANPTLVGVFGTSGTAQDVDVENNYAYIADGTNGLVIVDISNSSQPAFTGGVPGSNARGLDAFGDIVFVADSNIGLLVYDVSNRSAPEEQARFNSPGVTRDVLYHQGALYMANTSNGIVVFNFTDLEAPFQSTTVFGTLATSGLALAGNYLISITPANAVEIFGLDNLFQPNLLRTIGLPGVPGGASVGNTNMFIASGSGGISLVDLGELRFTSFYDRAHFSEAVVMNGHFAYSADGPSGLRTIDFSDPTAPTFVSNISMSGTVNSSILDGGYATSLVLAGELAYVADLNFGLRVFDLGDPLVPAMVGSLAIGTGAWGIALDGTTAWITNSQQGVVAVDISDPTEPVLLGSLAMAFTALDPALHGNYLFAPDIAGALRILDISNPAAPTLVTTFPTRDLAVDVAIADNRAYLLTSTKGLQILDISDPTAPVETGYYGDIDLAWALSLRGSLAFVAAGREGVVVIDIADPAHPFRTTALDTPGEARELAFSGNILLVADGGSGEVRSMNVTNAGRNSIIPWVVDNAAFTSRVALFNNGDQTASVRIRAVDRQGETREMTVPVPAESVFAAEAGELFTNFTGYSLFLETDADSLYPSFLTFNTEARSGGHSPSQTTAQYEPALTSSLLFGYVPGSEVAAIVLVAAGEKTGPIPVRLELYGPLGGLLDSVDIELTGNQPNASLVRDLFPDAPEDASVKAIAGDGTHIAGTTFVFNDLSQPSMAAAFPLPVTMVETIP